MGKGRNGDPRDSDLKSEVRGQKADDGEHEAAVSLIGSKFFSAIADEFPKVKL